jgi:hypothetical protein
MTFHRRDGIIRKERPSPYRKTAFFPVGATQQNRQACLTWATEVLATECWISNGSSRFDVRREVLNT